MQKLDQFIFKSKKTENDCTPKNNKMIEKNTNSSNKPSDVVYESIEEESAIEFIATDESSETHKNWEEIEDQTIQEMPEIVINEEIEDQTIQELPEILELINPAKNDLGNYLNHNISDHNHNLWWWRKSS